MVTRPVAVCLAANEGPLRGGWGGAATPAGSRRGGGRGGWAKGRRPCRGGRNALNGGFLGGIQMLSISVAARGGADQFLRVKL